MTYYIEGFHVVILASGWNYQFRIKEFGTQHITPVGKMLEKLRSTFYESDFKAEFTVNHADQINFLLITDHSEIAEYVNRLYVPAQVGT